MDFVFTMTGAIHRHLLYNDATHNLGIFEDFFVCFIMYNVTGCTNKGGGG